MVSRTSFIAAFLLAATATVHATDLSFDGGDQSTAVLLSFGEATSEVNVLCSDSGGVTVTDNDLFTVGTVSSAAAGSHTNYTIPMTFESGVGVDSYTVTCGSESITGSVTVAGFVIRQDGEIVSGENKKGIMVAVGGTTTYDVEAYGADGATVDVSSTSISARATSGVYMKELDLTKTKISTSTYTHVMTDYRAGSGSFVVDFETSSITVNGESFETMLKVTQDTSSAPKCVAMGGAVSASNGMVKIKMYNLLSPPQSSPVSEITLTVDGTTTSYDASQSSLVLPDQEVAFPVTKNGAATIKCDGTDATVEGDEIVVSGVTEGPELATSLISALPSSDTLSTITATIRIVNSDPSRYTRVEGEKLLNEFCNVCDGKECVVTGIRSGSAMVDVAALTPDGQAAQENLEKSFEEPSCSFQGSINLGCDEATLVSVRAKVVSGAVVANAAGLATWTIVLIAGLGAFALIALIMLGLLAVYRRSAEVSESDYSSSGPLGVPDPSDLLYEQSIVRDIYGRGDFPDGGPTAAVAEQRAREADLREEFPRPPSSSGLSRQSAATDDASSTYSV